MARPERPLSIHDLMLLIIRVMVGVVFVAHGCQKVFGWWGGPGMGGGEDGGGFIAMVSQLQLHIPFVADPVPVPMPETAAWLSALTELVGGVMLATGLISRVAALLLAGNMTVAILSVHYRAFFLPGGMEFPLTLAVICLTIVIGGPGRLTLFGILSGRAFRTRDEIAQARHDKRARRRLMEGEGLDEEPSTGISRGPLSAPPPPPARPVLRPGPSDASRSAPPPPTRPDMRTKSDSDEDR